MKIDVYVDEDCIEKGVRGNCEHCPIALNLKAQGYKDVEVLIDTCSVLKGSKWIKFNLPALATKFIKRFDDGLKPDPVSFTLENNL